MKYHTKKLAVIAAITGLFYMITPLRGQSQIIQSEVDTNRVYEMPEVIVSAGRYEQNPSAVGRNVSVISQQQIEQSVHSSVGDLLAEQLSLHIIGNTQTPGTLTQGFMRSTNSNHHVVMIDGVRISDPSTVNNSIDLSELSLLGVERIEIVRGSHSTLYGSSAMGGIINIITKKQGQGTFNVDLSTRNGTFGDDTFSTTNSVLANVTLENGFYTNLGFSYRKTNGLDATIDTMGTGAGYNPQDRDDFEKMDLNGKIGYKKENLDAYLNFRSKDQTVNLDQSAYTDDSNAKTDFRRDMFRYGASYYFSDRAEIRYEGAYSQLSRDFVNDSSLVNRQGDYDGTFVETNGDGTLLENALSGVFSFVNLKVLAGLESSVQTMKYRNHIFSRSRFGPFEQTTDLDSLNLKETINSIFIHTDINGGLINEGFENFSLVLGGRLSDHNEFGTHGTYEVNPRYRISSGSMVYAALTTGYNAPSLYRLHSPETSFGEQYSLGNSTLEPEESISYELGLKQTIFGAVNLNISLFKTKVSNVIEYVYLWDSNTDFDAISAADNLGDTFINASRQDINGLELGLEYQPASRFNFSGSFTYTESTLSFSPDDLNSSYTAGNYVQIYESGEFVNAEKELQGLTRRPGISALLSVRYKPIQKLQLQISSQFVGERDDVFYSSQLGPFGALDRSKMNAYNLTDLSARYDITENFTAVAKVENVFDKEYVEINGYNTRGRGLFLKLNYRLSR